MKKACSFLSKLAIFFLSFFITIVVTAQKTSTGITPKRADLAITEFKLVEATRNPATGLHKIKVSVTIKNNGDAPAGNTTLKMMIQNHLLNLVAPPNPQPKNPFLQLGENLPVNSIAPGQPLTTEYLFTEIKKVITTKSFNLVLLADAGNALKEINETDNNSTSLNVTPVDKAEYVAVRTAIQVTQQIARQDTFQYTIGRADFHMKGNRRTVPPEVFILMEPYGITLDRMGVDITTPIKHVTLMAPLHLPVGAVIRKVKFNYLKLAGTTNLVPHLVLRSHHQNAENEGWGFNTPVTSYWINSDARDGRGGYKVRSSITDAGFNVPVSPGSTYFFEILGGDALTTVTPTLDDSQWPTGKKIFIWSIQVYYTLN